MAARQRAPKQPADVRREEILDVAIRLFARGSYRAVGTAEIAREAGIAEPTIYRHFSTKRDLYLEALKRTGDDVLEHFRRYAAEQVNALEALQVMGMWYSESIIANSDLLQLRHRAMAETDDPEIQRRLREVYTEIVAVVAGVLRRGQSQGLITTDVSAEGLAWLYTAQGNIMDVALLIGYGPEAVCESPAFQNMQIAFLRAVVSDPRMLGEIHDQLHPERQQAPV